MKNQKETLEDLIKNTKAYIKSQAERIRQLEKENKAIKAELLFYQHRAKGVK